MPKLILPQSLRLATNVGLPLYQGGLRGVLGQGNEKDYERYYRVRFCGIYGLMPELASLQFLLSPSSSPFSRNHPSLLLYLFLPSSSSFFIISPLVAPVRKQGRNGQIPDGKESEFPAVSGKSPRIPSLFPRLILCPTHTRVCVCVCLSVSGPGCCCCFLDVLRGGESLSCPPPYCCIQYTGGCWVRLGWSCCCLGLENGGHTTG